MAYPSWMTVKSSLKTWPSRSKLAGGHVEETQIRQEGILLRRKWALTQESDFIFSNQDIQQEL